MYKFLPLKQLNSIIQTIILANTQMRQNIQQKSFGKQMKQTQNQAQNISNQDILSNEITDLKNPFQTCLYYLQPKNHNYFRRQYDFGKSTLPLSTMMNDLRQYQEVLFMEQIKLISHLEIHLHGDIFQPISKLFKYYDQLILKTYDRVAKIAQKYTKIKTHKKLLQDNHTNYQFNKNTICSQCEKDLVKIQLENLKTELDIFDFQDKYKFYKIDAINLYQLKKLRQESSNIDIQKQDKSPEMKEKSIGLEQYEEVLNLLSSDLYMKNLTFQQSIQYMNKICSKFQQETLQSKINQDELSHYEHFVKNKQMNKKLRIIMKNFFKKYHQLKVQNNRDCQVQVTIKQYQIIKQLEKQNKQLKMRIYRQQSDRLKHNQQIKLQIDSLKLQISKLTQQNKRLYSRQQDFEVRQTELRNRINILKKQNEQQHTKYTNIEFQYKKSLNSRRQSSRSRTSQRKNISKNTRFQNNKQRFSSKNIKTILKKQMSLNAQVAHDLLTEEDIKEDTSVDLLSFQKKMKKTLKKKDFRNPSILQNNQLSFTDLQKIQQSNIEEKKEEDQADQLIKKRRNSKSSRFRLLARLSHYQSDHNISPTDIPKNEVIINQTENVQEQQDKKVDTLTIQSAKNSIYEGNNTQINNKSLKLLTQLYQYQVKRQAISKISYQQFVYFYKALLYQLCSKDYQNIIEQHNNVFKVQKNITKHISQQRDKLINQINQQKKIKKQFIQSNLVNKQNKKSTKLLSLSKKSNYFLHKSKKNFSQYEQKTLHTISRTMQEPRLSNYIKATNEQKVTNGSHNNNMLNKIESQLNQTEIASQNIKQYVMFRPSHIIQLFGNIQNIQNLNKKIKNVDSIVINSAENQFMMNSMTLLAQLHLQDQDAYDCLKTIIINPAKIIETKDIKYNLKQEKEVSLQAALKYLIILHRSCNINKHQFCSHLQNLQNILKNLLLSEPTRPKLKSKSDKKIKNIKPIKTKILSLTKKQPNHP